jgi:S-adenosylmethionine hydrolase
LTIALLTDFGTRDVFVGVMRGVIAQIAPQARLIDLTHDIPPGDVRAAALRLWQAGPFMPRGTVFLAVVDPGVGSDRAAVAVSTDRFTCVGPDNGLFTFLLAQAGEARAVEISSDAGQAGLGSSTFHGRDIFAPAAARLASGARLAELGPAIKELKRLAYPRLELLGQGKNEPRSVRGETLLADQFGNIITSIGALQYTRDVLKLEPWVPACLGTHLPLAGLRTRLGNREDIPLVRTYSDVPRGSPLAYVGSSGLLEVGVNDGRAIDLFQTVTGAEVLLHLVKQLG